MVTTELIRFGAVGLLATATHVGLFYGLMLAFGVAPTLATTAAFPRALAVSYSLNRSWTFRLGCAPSLCLLVIIALVPGFSFLLQKHWGFQ